MDLDEHGAWVLAGLAAVSTVFYAARNAVLGFWRYIESLVIIRIDTFGTDVYAWQVYRWLKANGRMVHVNNVQYGTTHRLATQECLTRERSWAAYHEDQGGGYIPFLYRLIPLQSLWLVHGWKPVWFTKSVNSAGNNINGNNINDNNSVNTVLVTFRWLLSPDHVLTDMVRTRTQWYASAAEYNRFFVRPITGTAQSYVSSKSRVLRPGEPSDDSLATQVAAAMQAQATGAALELDTSGSTPFEEAGDTPCMLSSNDIRRGLSLGSRLEDLWVSDEVLEIFQELTHWKTGRSWFTARGVPWKRGYGLVGPPGNGKTSVIRAMAAGLGLPVFLYDLASLTNAELAREWSRMLDGHAPCVAVLEDLDRVFSGDKPREGVVLGYECLLNILDGISASAGVCVFVTSNKPEQLDEALMRKLPDGSYVTRPGRIDKVVELNSPPEQGRRKIAQRILLGLPQDVVEQTVQAGEGDSGAAFQFRCFKVAERYFWETERDGGKPVVS